MTGRGGLTAAPQASTPLPGPEIADAGAYERNHDNGDNRGDDAGNSVSCRGRGRE